MPMTLATRAYDGRMRHRTPAYWPTRIMLAVGIVATALVVAFPLLAAAAPQGPMFVQPPDILGLPRDVAFWLEAAGAAVFGLVWMVRIFRGTRDEPPAWRYRDR